MAREHFTFRRDWVDGWEDMSAAERLEYIEAIVRYGLTGKRKAMSHYVRGRMVAVMRDVDEQVKREDAFIEQQRLNGSKKWHKEKKRCQPQPMPNLPRHAMAENPHNKETRVPAHPHAYTASTIQLNTNVQQPHNKETRVPAHPHAYTVPNLPRHAMAENPHNKETRVPAHPHAYTDGVSIPLRSIDTNLSSSSSSFPLRRGVAATGGGGGFSSIIDQWNSAIKAAGSPIRTICSVTPGTKRHTLVLGLVQQYGEDGVREAIGRLLACGYTNGGSNIGWLPTFDWFVQPDNFVKVLEGNFRELRAAQPATTKPASAPKPAPPPQLPAPPASSEDKEAFVRVKERLRRTQGEAFVRKWLDCCRLWVRDGNRVSIACPSGYVAEELRQKHAGAILQAARAEWGKSTDVWLDVVRGIETTETE